MALFRKTKSIGGDDRVDLEFNRVNLKRTEMLARHYGRNHEFQTYLNHAIGLVHNCATINAKACTQIPLRLFKVQEARSDQRQFGTRAMNPRTKAGIRNGSYGTKVASIATSGRDMVEVESHPLLDLLANPNPLYPGSMLEHQKWYSLWIGGNAYELASEEGFEPYMLSPMLSQWVSIEASIENTIERYIYGRSETGFQSYTADEVIQYKLYPSPHTPLEGIGAAYGVLPHADLIQDSLLHDISMAKNGMHPDGIWMLPEGTTPENGKKFERQLNSKFKGVRDWWKHLIFTGKIEFISPQIPEKELMSLPKMQEASKLIRQAFGHTESMADSTDTNVASAIQSYDKQYLGGTIWPALINDAATKSQYLLPMFGLDPDLYCFAYDNPVERDEARFADRMRLDISSGLRTINEARSEMGLPEANDEFADKLLVNGQPLGASTAPADPFAGLFGGSGGSLPPKEPEAVEDNEGDSEPVDEDTEKAFDPASIVESLKSLESKFYKSCPCCSTKAVEDPDNFADDPIVQDSQERFEPGMRDAMTVILEEAQQDAMDDIMAGRDPDLADRAEQTAIILAEEMKPSVEFGFNQFLEAVNAPASAFDIVDQRAIDFLATYTPQLANDLMGTTADMAVEAVRIGQEQGLGQREIADLIEGVPRHRAEAIARTETQVAVQSGKREAMLEIGTKEHKAITAPGVRKSHAAIAAQGFIPIDQPFVEDGDEFGGEIFNRTMFIPPFGVNCRCAVVAKHEGADV